MKGLIKVATRKPVLSKHHLTSASQEVTMKLQLVLSATALAITAFVGNAVLTWIFCGPRENGHGNDFHDKRRSHKIDKEVLRSPSKTQSKIKHMDMPG